MAVVVTASLPPLSFAQRVAWQRELARLEQVLVIVADLECSA